MRADRCPRLLFFRRLGGGWIASCVVTGGLLAWLLSQIDIALMTATVRDMRPAHVWMFLVLLLAGVAARALRFRVLLGAGVRLPLLTGIVLVRNLFVDLLPARMGELSYVYLLASRAGRPVADGVASLFLSVAFDVVALAPLLVLAVLAVGGVGAVSGPWLAWTAVALGLLAFGGARVAGPAGRTLSNILAPPGAHGTGRVAALGLWVRRTALALDDAWSRGIAVPVLALSIVVRLCKFGSYFFLVLAIMEALGSPLPAPGFFSVFLGVLGAELAAALPIPTVASFGTYEAAWAIAFTELGFARQDAIISGVLTHAISQAVEYAVGGLALIVIMRPRAASSRE